MGRAENSVRIELEHSHKRLLRNLNGAEPTHTLFAFLLLFELMF